MPIRRDIAGHFLLLVALVGVSSSSDAARKSQEDDIRQAVFLYQFEHNASGGKNHAHDYFLSIVEDDRDAFGHDLPDPFMARFAGHKPPVRKFSDCRVKNDGEVVRKHSGKPGLLFMTGSITWLSDTTVTVNGGYYEGNVSSSGNVYTVSKENGTWKVVKDQMTVISQLIATPIPKQDCKI